MTERPASSAPHQPLVSVLTPSLNQGLWLRDALRSVALQTYPNIEHIVRDGGSSDRSLDVLAATGPSVRWTSVPDGGQSNALNAAFGASRGEIIGWINADDAYFDRNVFSDVVAVFQREPDVGVVYGHTVLVNADGLILHTMWVPKFNARLLRRYGFIFQPGTFIRRSALQAHGFVDEAYEYGMDRELWLRLAASCRFERIDRIVAVDRHHADRKSYLRQDLAAQDWKRLEAQYDVDFSRVAMVRARITKVRLRIAGLILLRGLHAPLAFAGRIDSMPRLLIRQLSRRRRSMRLS
jgi:glycosyltransferase involved in cell wall biosynthesis